MKLSFWDAFEKASHHAEGFTVTFYMEGGHVLKDVATMPTVTDCIHGYKITEECHVPVTIRTASVVAYEIEES